MKTLPEIERRRDTLLQEMRLITQHEKGHYQRTISQSPAKGSKPVLRGPYHVLSQT